MSEISPEPRSIWPAILKWALLIIGVVVAAVVVVGLFVLAHNLLRTAVLAPHLIGWGTGASAIAATAA